MASKFKVGESPLFQKQHKRICRDLHLEAAPMNRVLNAVRWGFANDPREFPLVPGTSKMRYAKTKRSGKGTKAIPMLLIMASVDEPTAQVELLTVETLDVHL